MYQKTLTGQTTIESADIIANMSCDIPIHFPTTQVHTCPFFMMSLFQRESLTSLRWIHSLTLIAYIRAAAVKSPVEIWHSTAESLQSTTLFNLNTWGYFLHSRPTSTSSYVISIHKNTSTIISRIIFENEQTNLSN